MKKTRNTSKKNQTNKSCFAGSIAIVIKSVGVFLHLMPKAIWLEVIDPKLINGHLRKPK